VLATAHSRTFTDHGMPHTRLLQNTAGPPLHCSPDTVKREGSAASLHRRVQHPSRQELQWLHCQVVNRYHITASAATFCRCRARGLTTSEKRETSRDGEVPIPWTCITTTCHNATAAAATHQPDSAATWICLLAALCSLFITASAAPSGGRPCAIMKVGCTASAARSAANTCCATNSGCCQLPNTYSSTSNPGLLSQRRTPQLPLQPPLL